MLGGGEGVETPPLGWPVGGPVPRPYSWSPAAAARDRLPAPTQKQNEQEEGSEFTQAQQHPYRQSSVDHSFFESNPPKGHLSHFGFNDVWDEMFWQSTFLKLRGFIYRAYAKQVEC